MPQMVSSLAQLIALVAHGNAYLTGRYDVPDFYPNNSAFQYCNEVVFVGQKRRFRLTTVDIARDPNDWFRFLRQNGCCRLSLGHQATRNSELPDHLSVAFVGGGGTEYIASHFPKQTFYWFGRWRVTEGDAPDKIWRVTYVRAAARGTPYQLDTDDLSGCIGMFESTLKRTEEFAVRHKTGFEANFRKGLETLVSDDPEDPTRDDDLLPEIGYSVAARRLIAAAQAAWVFGGMGSWNDLGFRDQAENNEYQELSRQLYAAINACIERSVNSFRAPQY